MENQEIIKERNHFIPKTYLEKFLSKEGKLFVYKKGEVFFRQGITKKERLLVIEGEDGLNIIAVKNKLYIPDGDFPEDKNILEDFFAQEIEAKYNDFLNDVERNFLNAQEIFKNHRDYIILLIASMLSRTPQSKIELEEIYKVGFQAHNWAQSFDGKREEKLKAYLREKVPNITDENAKKTIKSYVDMVAKGKFDLKLPRNLFIKHIIENIEKYGRMISDMTIQIVRCEDPNYFITTDAPVVYFVPDNKVRFPFSVKSLGGPHTELYFPLSKKLCLVLTRMRLDVFAGLTIKKDMVDMINYNLSYNSQNFIFSSIEDSTLDKFIESYIPYPYKIVMK